MGLNLIRLLVLSLLLANALYFAWSQWLAPPVVSDRVESDTGAALPRIQLLSELPQPTPPPAPATDAPSTPDASVDAALSAASGAAAPAAAATFAPLGGTAAAPSPAGTGVAGTTASRCLTIGPFDSESRYDTAARRIADSRYAASQRRVAAEVPDGYMVMIRGIANRAAQQRVQRRLRQAGIADAYPLPALPDGLAVSAGLFSERDRADRRAAEIRKQGFRPEVNARRRPGEVYWLDLRPTAVVAATAASALEAEIALRQRFAALSESDDALGFRERPLQPCP